MKQFERVLNYPGSKWRIAQAIVEMIPEHHSYLEPYFGSGAVFFKKEPAAIETINDLNDDIPNLFECIRDDPERVANQIAMTPYSRRVYDDTFKKNPEDRYEKATQFLIKCWMGYGYRMGVGKPGWKNDVQGREAMYALRNWNRLPDNILSTVGRLKRVQIENRPAIDVIKRFNNKRVFIYVDPPYLMETRKSARRQYTNEMTEADHIELLEELRKSSAKVMISGYESDLYNEQLKSWNKRRLISNRQGGQRTTEVIWMSY